MPRTFLGRILALGLALPATVFALGAIRPGDDATPSNSDQPHRSPIALALSADGSRLLTANHTAGTVSLVDTAARKVLAEVPTGDRPMGVAISPDGKRGAVSHWYGYDLAILAIGPDSMEVVDRVEVGPEPRGVVLSHDGTTAYVALGAAHEVVRVDLGEGKITGRVAVGTEPRDLEITQDGAKLLVGNARSSDLSVVRTDDLTVERTLKIDGVNLRQVAIDPAGEFGYVANMRNRRMATVDRNIDLGWVLGQRLTRVSLDGSRDFATQTLDPQGKAAGDAHGVALGADGKYLAVSCGGTHEVMLFRTDLGRLPWRTGGSRDLIHASLLSDDGKFRRVETGGRPTELAFAPDGKTLYVANYLSDSVQVLDADTAQIVGEIALGAPSENSLERRGEILFHAAERSFNQWYSCNTCHSDGHTNGENFDTKNDGWHDFSTTPTLSQKQVPTLRGVARTGPWTWHGWQTSLDDAVDESFTKSMQGKKPTDDETRAVSAFLSSLDHPRNPNLGPGGSISEAARRGEALFRSAKAACSNCHPAPEFTDGKNHLIGLEERQDVYEGYNPPSLLGVYDTAPYLHDGRASTLHDVLAGDHSPEIAAGLDKLTDQEIDDLVAYLRTL